MRAYILFLAGVLTIVPSSKAQETSFTPLFNGRSLEGWEGDETVFRVMDGAIVGGTLDRPVAQRDYLCTTQEFDDFELRLAAKLEGAQNAGVNFRSQRIPSTNEVGGYQADIGFIPGRFIPMLSDVTDIDTSRRYPLWGSLVDEFREQPGRYGNPEAPYWLLAVADLDVVEGVLRPDDWNELAVRAVGPRIEIRLNGVRTVEFVEPEDLVQDGLIYLQVHDGGPSMAWYKHLEIRQLDRR